MACCTDEQVYKSYLCLFLGFPRSIKIIHCQCICHSPIHSVLLSTMQGYKEHKIPNITVNFSIASVCSILYPLYENNLVSAVKIFCITEYIICYRVAIYLHYITTLKNTNSTHLV